MSPSSWKKTLFELGLTTRFSKAYASLQEMQQKLSLLQSGGDTPWFMMSFTYYISILRNLIFVLCWGLLEACENFSDSILVEGCKGQN